MVFDQQRIFRLLLQSKPTFNIQRILSYLANLNDEWRTMKNNCTLYRTPFCFVLLLNTLMAFKRGALTPTPPLPANLGILSLLKGTVARVRHFFSHWILSMKKIYDLKYFWFWSKIRWDRLNFMSLGVLGEYSKILLAFLDMRLNNFHVFGDDFCTENSLKFFVFLVYVF